MPSGPFIILSEVDSTNNYAMAKLHALQIQAGSCFQAVKQSAGKGQRGRRWEAEKGANITMSVCVEPGHAAFPFLLSATMALGCYDFIKECGIKNAAVKWPNDLYIGDRKTAGILIESAVRGNVRDWAVVGVGMNVNQQEFGTLGSRATSLKKELSALSGTASGEISAAAKLDVTALAKRLHRHLLLRLGWMNDQRASEIMEQYNSVLYLKNKEVRLKKDTAVFTTVISHVTVSGELVTNDVMERIFRVGEVEFV